MQPPATTILYDQLDQILAELGKANLHYGVIAVQSELDAEAPVPSAGIDLRLTDRDVILARLDLPQSQFDSSTRRRTATGGLQFRQSGSRADVGAERGGWLWT